MITTNAVSYRAGRKQLLQDISFHALPGEVLAIIGANGAGKSTLLKLLSKEIEPSAGGILFCGKQLSDQSAKELAQKRAVLTQHQTVSLSFTVKELVLMGRYPHFDRQPNGHDQEMVRQAMEHTGIVHLAGRNYDTLSGGEQQRVQLARTIAQILDVPDAWLFLDEPTNGLDLLHQQQLLQLARKLAAKGFGVICILHDINHAAAYADKILVLKQGSQLAYGTPAQVIGCELIHQAFGVQVKIVRNDELNCPLVIATGTHHH